METTPTSITEVTTLLTTQKTTSEITSTETKPVVTTVETTVLRRTESSTPPTTTSTVVSSATTEPIQTVNGSKYPERIQYREAFLKELKVVEYLANIPEVEKVSLGYTADEFILDCQYSGYLCHSSGYVFSSKFANFAANFSIANVI